MVIKVDLSSNASVRLVCVDEGNTGAAYLANLYIPIFNFDGKIVHRYEVSNQIVGLTFHPSKSKVLYAIDDSFGLHIFDLRSNSKRKIRLNPDVENHQVICTAVSAENQLAVSSSEFSFGSIMDVRGARRGGVVVNTQPTNIVSLFDIRNSSEPVTSFTKRHKAEVTSMEYYRNGQDLLTGAKDGAIKCFDCHLRDEDNACRWERWTRGPITKVGVINKRIVYGISDRSEASVFLDNKGELETLYGVTHDKADEVIRKTSKAFYKKPEYLVGLIKGVNDEIPLVGVHGVENESFLSLTAMTQDGTRQAKPMLTYPGHVGEVKCMTATPEFVFTGGEDGKVCIQIANFKNPKFGEDNIDHHPLTLDRGNLAELHDTERGNTDKSDSSSSESESDSEEDSSDSSESESDDSGPCTSTAPPKKKSTSKKTKKDSKPSTSASSSTSKAKEEKEKAEKEAKKKEAEKKEAERKAKKEEAEKKVKKEEAERKKKEEAEKKAKREAAKKKAAEQAEKEAKKKAEEKKAKKEEAKKKTEEVEKKEAERKARKEAEKKDADRKARKEEARKEEARRKEKQDAKKKAEKKEMTKEEQEAEAKRLADREARIKMKLAETKEQRAARKDRERKERQAKEEQEERERKERKQKEREERKKRQHDEGVVSSSTDAKKSKHK